MNRPIAPDETAVRALTNALAQQLSHMNLPSIAASAYVQANLCQAAFDGLLKLVKTKNIVGEAEVSKCLADAYNLALSRLMSPGIQIAANMPTVKGP